MSQDTFPFEAQTASYADEADGARNKKALLVAGGVVAALVLGAGAYLFLGGGGAEEDDFSFVPKTRAPGAAAAAPKAPAKPVAKKLPTAYKEQLGRDPFRALHVAPAAGAGVAAPAAAPAAPAAGPAAPTTTTGTTPAGAGSTPVVQAKQRYPLKLTAITKSGETYLSSWLVDGQKRTVLPAQRFGKYGELVVLAFNKNARGVVDGAILQVGDDSPMEVKIGETRSVL